MLPGYREIPQEDSVKAARFFDSAKAKASAGQYDYAIELYLNGLSFDPESIDAHKALRDVALKRKASGGKAMGMFEKMKVKSSKDDKQNLLNAEKFLAYDPGERSYMRDMLTAGYRAGCYDTVMWIATVLMQANRDHPKPDIQYYLALRDSYKLLRQWKLAMEATQYALTMRPEDMDLQREVKDLSAMETMDSGGYAEGKSFRESIKDKEGQQRLLEQDADVRSVDVLTRQILDAEKEWRADPLETGKLMRLVDVLVKTEDPQHENRAIEILEDAHKRTNSYRFRFAMLRIQMKQMDRMERFLRQEVNASPGDAKALEDYKAFAREKAERELANFNESSEQYPTDMGLKFEAAMRLVRLSRHDEAIPLLQLVRNDPKFRTDGSIQLGQAFLSAGFADEAADTFAHLAEEYQVRGDARSLEIHYWWGRSLEAKSPPDVSAALKCYSQVFQWSATHKDVQQRIKRLRTGNAPAAGT
jgi:tetratricopeptide (TPR) repeat protein